MSIGLPDNQQTRMAIIAACRRMNASGINQGTSGNISVRTGEGGQEMIITPSGIAYADLEPEMLVRMPLDACSVRSNAGCKPSSEWQIHHALLRKRRDMNVVIHAHPAYACALAIIREPIPACHYMVAAFGGDDVPLTGYHLFGSAALAKEVCEAMTERHACLMANHGVTVVGATLDKAIWRLEELEHLARVYTISRQIGTPVIISHDEMQEVLAAFSQYGPVGIDIA